MSRLKKGDKALFKAYDGRLISGTVLAVLHNCYLVLGDTEYCTMYQDRLFRFTDANLEIK